MALMYWGNLPHRKHGKVVDDKIKLNLTGPTDLYRKHRDGHISDETSPFYFRKLDNDFTVSVQIHSKNLSTLHDQVGLYIKESAKSYVTFGFEINQPPYVDTFVSPLTNYITITKQKNEDKRDITRYAIDKYNKHSVFLKVKRYGKVLLCYSSPTGDEESYVLNRVICFTRTIDAKLSVGVYAAAPASDGFKTTFNNFRITDEQSHNPGDYSILSLRPKNDFVGESDGQIGPRKQHKLEALKEKKLAKAESMRISYSMEEKEKEAESAPAAQEEKQQQQQQPAVEEKDAEEEKEQPTQAEEAESTTIEPKVDPTPTPKEEVIDDISVSSVHSSDLSTASAANDKDDEIEAVPVNTDNKSDDEYFEDEFTDSEEEVSLTEEAEEDVIIREARRSSCKKNEGPAWPKTVADAH